MTSTRKTRQARHVPTPDTRSEGQRCFELYNPWAVGSVVDWSKVSQHVRDEWEAKAIADKQPYVEPAEPLQFHYPEDL